MKILIYGFGRMGLTHYAILNSLVTAKFTFIEPNKKLNFLLKKNINALFFKDDNSLLNKFDLTLITTPPFAHNEIVKSSIKRGDKLIFVEKPFGGHFNNSSDSILNNLYVGYVLRFNPVINWIKKNIKSKSVVKVQASYLSNTIENKPKGWRNGKFSGVLNEMGSHIIDLANYLFDLSSYKVVSSKLTSHISDIDDEVSAKIISDSREFIFYFNWVKKDIRKPIFEFKISLDNGDTIIFDQQKIEIISAKEIKKNIYISEINKHVPYYLRGTDFTSQMQDLIKEKNILCTQEEALLVNNIMNEIIINEDNIRG